MSNVSNEFLGVLSGNDHFTPPNPVKDAVRVRAEQLIPKIEQKHPKGWGACYDGNRCKPENLGWRFQQMHGSPDAQAILDGGYDLLIVETYHEAASSEHWYRYEKDWGEPEW